MSSQERGQARPRAEIVATGEEIRCGSLVDTNSAWLAERLEGLGLRVERITALGDDAELLAELLLQIVGRSEVALVTGGLGPTDDDLTAEAVSRASGQPLTLNARGLEQIEAFFAARGRRMPATNRKQAMLPAGSELLENPRGTAPGFALTLSGCRLFCLPGVPAEMEAMFEQGVIPGLQESLGRRLHPADLRTIRTFGLTESETAERLQGFRRAFPEIGLGYRASFPEIQVKLSLPDAAPGRAARLDEAVRWVERALGRAVFATDGRSLEQVVGELLRAGRATLAAAESCTGGLISHLLTGVAGSSDYLLLSAVTYANAAKTELLGVDSATLQEHGAVSEQTAEEMARGVLWLAKATYGLATTGIAGPGGGTPGKPVGTVCLGLAGPEGTETRCLHFPFPERTQNKRIFAVAALDLLRRRLQSSAAGP